MDHYEKYLGLVYRYLSFRNRSEKEIREYLIKKNAPDEVSVKIIAVLYEQKFLNDEAFAREWIRSRARFRPKGKRLLQIELAQKGIDEETILKVLKEEQEDVPDELTQAKKLIGKRVERLQGESRYIIYQKVGAFLGRRGFSWEISKKAIDVVMNNEDNV